MTYTYNLLLHVPLSYHCFLASFLFYLFLVCAI